MAQGRPSKWAQVTIDEPFLIGKQGITIKVWDKFGRQHLGHAKITIGGIRWTPFKKQKPSRLIKWSELDQM